MGSEIIDLIQELKIESHNLLSSILYIVFIIFFVVAWP